jgi:hypothetical protein
MNSEMFMKWVEHRLMPTFNKLHPGKKMILIMDVSVAAAAAAAASYPQPISQPISQPICQPICAERPLSPRARV